MTNSNAFVEGENCCPFCEQKTEPPRVESVSTAGQLVEVNHVCPECNSMWTSFYRLESVYGIGI